MEQNDRHEKSLDLDVTLEEAAEQRPYPPRKKPGLRPLWLGIVVVALVIVGTYFAFGGPGTQEPMAEAPAVAAQEGTGAAPSAPELPDKAQDAVSFSPTPEMTAADAAAVEEAKAAEAKAAEEAKVAAAVKAAEAKAAEEAKVAAAAKAADAKAAEEAKVAAAAKAAEEAKAAEAKATAAKPAQIAPQKPAAPAKPTEAETKAAAAKAAEAKPAEAPPSAPVAETPAVATAQTPAAEVTISDQWVVNISSTPDAAESLRLLSRVMARKVPGEDVYAYDTTINGVVQHRIRVGFFADRAAAEAVGLKIQEEFKLTATPWAVQPTTDEVARFKK